MDAVRHGVESRAGKRTIEIAGEDAGLDVELRVTDDGPGIPPDLRRRA